MSTTTERQASLSGARVLAEGYGPGAWHGPDLNAALSDVTDADAFARPKPERHNIAEVALHHAYYVRAVRGQLSGATPEPFPLEGEDWFAATADGPLGWPEIRALVDAQQQRLATLVSDIDSGRVSSPLSDEERLGLVLGITCHAVYHAGQVQLIKRICGL
jgi:hypothetical protein